jgi:hypothetical protein
MPSFLEKALKQHTTSEANISRCVTKVRWVVEAANGRLKKWKYLDHVVPIPQIPFIGDFVRIIASIINKYKPPLKSNSDGDDELGRKMRIACSQTENPLQKPCATLSFNKRSQQWRPIDAQDLMLDFPMLSLADLRNITFGV